jgi:sugar fermentation stimulation protein A
MLFPAPLVCGTLVRRYKRFLADVVFDGETATAHVANSGSMLGCADPGSEVWLSPATNPGRKLRWTWELVRAEGALVGINTMHPNRIVAEAIEDGTIPELTGYGAHRREVRYGRNSRIDILLSGEGRPDCYVEIKNVTLRRNGHAEFPDAVTARGTKHLAELSRMVAGGARAVMLYLVQRGDCDRFRLAANIDSAYAAGLASARAAGVEILCYGCRVTPKEVAVNRVVTLAL